MLTSTHAFEDTLSQARPRDVVAKLPPIPSGLEWFKYIFENSVAQTREQREVCFRTRFQVYCLDNRFEDPDENPGGFEVDAFDTQSVHSLLTHRASGNAIGTVRLVLPYLCCERRPLPIELLLAGEPMPFPIGRTAEISRFAIVKSFHKHTPTRGIEAALPQEEWRKLLLHLPLGLIRACLEMSAREGLTHLAAVMEPSLLRLLTRFGIHMNRFGGLVEYHGRRQPCWVELDAMLDRVLKERPDVWRLLTDNGRFFSGSAHAALN